MMLSGLREPHHSYAAPGKHFDAAPVPSTLLFTKPSFFFKQTKVDIIRVEAIFSDLNCSKNEWEK
jgi:hypothetical protein